MLTHKAKYTALKMYGTHNHHNITLSFKLQGYQSVQLGSISNYESISPVLVQMKVTTGALERQQQDNLT